MGAAIRSRLGVKGNFLSAQKLIPLMFMMFQQSNASYQDGGDPTGQSTWAGDKETWNEAVSEWGFPEHGVAFLDIDGDEDFPDTANADPQGTPYGITSFDVANPPTLDQIVEAHNQVKGSVPSVVVIIVNTTRTLCEPGIDDFEDYLDNLGIPWSEVPSSMDQWLLVFAAFLTALGPLYQE